MQDIGKPDVANVLRELSSSWPIEVDDQGRTRVDRVRAASVLLLAMAGARFDLDDAQAVAEMVGAEKLDPLAFAKLAERVLQPIFWRLRASVSGGRLFIEAFPPRRVDDGVCLSP